jgi:hypothetical protein
LIDTSVAMMLPVISNEIQFSTLHAVVTAGVHGNPGGSGADHQRL